MMARCFLGVSVVVTANGVRSRACDSRVFLRYHGAPARQLLLLLTLFITRRLINDKP